MSTGSPRSRPSKNNCQDRSHGAEPPVSALGPDDLDGETGLRPISVEPERRLREEATHEHTDAVRARPWYAVVNEWREWYSDYQNAHIEFEDPDGETFRTQLENSYMPEYGKRYYAKLKDLERGIERRFESLTTVMLTFSASTLNANGAPRCPGDHMRDIADGWDTARKQLHQTLSGENWDYAKVWEPHSGGERGAGGYGHMHVAVFVESDGVEAEQFEPVMRSHVERCGPAGKRAHRNTPCDEHRGEGANRWDSADSACDECDVAVSVNDNVENIGSYISEYIGIFGDETLERSITEQMFYAVTWATNTRRVEFSNGAQSIISGEQFRRETGLKPEDRGEAESRREDDVGTVEVGESGWSVESICRADRGGPEYHDATGGGVEMVEIDGATGVDPPPEL